MRWDCDTMLNKDGQGARSYREAASSMGQTTPRPLKNLMFVILALKAAQVLKCPNFKG